MLDISVRNGMMFVNRGDDFSFRIKLLANDCGDAYELSDKDGVYVGVMEPRGHFEDALIRKRYGKEDQNADCEVVVSMKSSDTEKLLPGTYYIQAKLNQWVGTSESGEDSYEISTILPKTKFVVLD